MGAAQIALIARQPIPKYKYGTDYHKGGAAIVGDGGVKEYVKTPDGEVYETPSFATLVDIPKGAQVFPNYAAFSVAMISPTPEAIGLYEP